MSQDDEDAKVPRRRRKSTADPVWRGEDLMEAVAMWREIGYLGPGQIGAALKPLVKEFGWAAVKPWWKQYIELRPHQGASGNFDRVNPDYRFMSPQDFVRTYRIWERLCEPESP